MQAIHLLQQSPLALYVVTCLFGLAVGSFLNVVVARLPKMMERQWRRECCSLLELQSPAAGDDEFTLVRPRSRCPKCGHAIAAWENIPVLSFLILRGRCSACRSRISLRYPLLEALTGVLSVMVAWRFGFSMQVLPALLFTWVLIALSAIDLDTQLLPDNITLPLLWAGLICNMFGVYTNVYSALIGAAAGYLILWCVYWLFKIITGKEGMGYGDFKLLAALGAWAGYQMLPLIIIIASLIGAVVGIGLILLKGHGRNQPIPFGPYLAGAGWIALLWGPPLTSLYIGWVR